MKMVSLMDLKRQLDVHSKWLVAAGTLLVIGWHWLQWRRDSPSQLKSGPSGLISSSRPKVSVLVAAWEETSTIRDHIRSFLDLRYPNKELVLCAGGRDGTFQIAKQFASSSIHVVEQHPGEGKQRALQRCLEHSSGSIVFLTDADCVLNDAAFEQTLAPLLDEGEVAVTGWVCPLEEQRKDPFIDYLWLTQQYWMAHSPVYLAGLDGRNAAVKRETLESVGGFDDDVVTGTDLHLAKLLLGSGYRIRNAPSSLIATPYPTTLREYWRQRSRWARNNLLHGLRFQTWQAVVQELRASSVAAIVVIVPLTLAAMSPFVWALWVLVIQHLFLLRLRLLWSVNGFSSQAPHPVGRYLMPIIVYVFVDCLASCRAVFECLVPPLRTRW